MSNGPDSDIPLTNLELASGLLQEWLTFKSGIDRPRGERKKISTHDRSYIIGLGRTQSTENAEELRQILLYELSENNRESAIKALGEHGGEVTIALLEAINLGNEPAKFGKMAAGNALTKLGLFRGEAPLLTPDSTRKSFIRLDIIHNLDRSICTGDYNTSQVINFDMLELDIIPIAVENAGRLYLYCKDQFRVGLAHERAIERGLTIKSYGEDIVAVEGDNWPGFGYGRPYLSFIFSVQKPQDQNELLIISNSIPGETETKDWAGAVRLLMRLGRWLGGPEVINVPAEGAAAEQAEVVAEDDTGDDQALGLLNLADELGQ